MNGYSCQRAGADSGGQKLCKSTFVIYLSAVPTNKLSYSLYPRLPILFCLFLPHTLTRGVLYVSELAYITALNARLCIHGRAQT